MDALYLSRRGPLFKERLDFGPLLPPTCHRRSSIFPNLSSNAFLIYFELVAACSRAVILREFAGLTRGSFAPVKHNTAG